MGMSENDRIISNLTVLWTWAAVNPKYGIGLSVDDCRKAAGWLDEAIKALKGLEQEEGWICEKRTSGSQPTDLLCACSNKVFFTTLLFKDGFTANELFCQNCGLTMRSPGKDKDGMWLKKEWKEVVLKEREPLEPVIIAGQYECGECRYELRADADSYCPCCGRKVKWE